MTLDTMHPEDVRAAIRKKHGSIRAFVRAKGLPETGVSDFLRGRTSQRVRDAIEAVIADVSSNSITLDRSRARRGAHGQNVNHSGQAT